MIYDEKPETLKIALDAYIDALKDESAEELKDDIKNGLAYDVFQHTLNRCE